MPAISEIIPSFSQIMPAMSRLMRAKNQIIRAKNQIMRIMTRTMSASKYLISLVVVLCTVTLFQNFVIKNELYDTSNFKFEPNINTIFMGASHTRMTFSDEMFPHSINLGYDSETMLLSFLKAKIVLDNNPQVKDLILTVYPANFSAGAEKLFDLFPDLEDNLYTYLKYDDETSVFNVSNDVGIHIESYINSFFKHNIGLALSEKEIKALLQKLFLIPSELNYLGIMGYEPQNDTLFGNTVTEEENVQFFIGRHYLDENGNPMDTSKIMEKYFFGILDACFKKNINVFLVRTPETFSYRDNIPKVMSTNFERIISNSTKKYPNVTYVDYASFFDNSEENFFWDCQHVLTKGSERISRHLYKHVKAISVSQ